MNKYTYTFSCFLMFCLLIISPSESLHAQEIITDNPNTTLGLSIDNLSLDQSSYSSNSAVGGSFKVLSNQAKVYSSLRYKLEILADLEFEGEKTKIILGGSNFVDISNPDNVDFEYKLPKYLPSSEIEMRVKLYLGSDYVAMSETDFKFSGPIIDNTAFVDLSFIIDDKQYPIFAIPGIEDEDIYLKLELKSPYSEDVIPRIEVYSVSSDSIVLSENLEVLSSDSELLRNIALPKQGSGIYDVSIKILDQSGNLIEDMVSMKYIVSDKEAEINYISVEGNDFSKGQSINIEFNYFNLLSESNVFLGDIQSVDIKSIEETDFEEPLSEINNYSYVVTLKNSENRILDTLEGDLVNSSTVSIPYTFKEGGTDDLLVQVELFVNDELVDTKEELFAGEGQSEINLLYLSVLVLIFMVVLLLLVTLRKKDSINNLNI